MRDDKYELIGIMIGAIIMFKIGNWLLQRPLLLNLLLDFAFWAAISYIVVAFLVKKMGKKQG